MQKVTAWWYQYATQFEIYKWYQPLSESARTSAMGNTDRETQDTNAYHLSEIIIFQIQQFLQVHVHGCKLARTILPAR